MNAAPPQRSVAELLGLAETDGAGSTPPASRTPRPDLTVKVTGVGWQGILLLGQILAEMGLREGQEVSWLQSYGPEMRSGSAHCHACFSKERVGSPLIEHADVLSAMNEPSLPKFAPQVAPNGLLLYNGEALPVETALAVLKTRVCDAALLEVNRRAIATGIAHSAKTVPPPVVTTV